MTRADLFKNVRSGVREYRRSSPDGAPKSVSEWLLALMQTNTSSIIKGNWGRQEREYYFYKLLSIAILCMDDNGIVMPGRYAPLERLVRAEDTALDSVLLAIDRGCGQYASYVGNSATDLVVMINYYLSQAIESQPRSDNTAWALEMIRDIASLATLGLETNGDHNAETN